MSTLRTRIGDRPVVIDPYTDEDGTTGWCLSFDRTHAEVIEQMYSDVPVHLPREFRSWLISGDINTVMLCAMSVVEEYENNVDNWS